jgi:hypothetical protein
MVCRGFLDVIVDQFAHVRVALGRGVAAEDDSDDVPAVAVNRGDEIKARRAGVPGLDAIDATDNTEQMIVVAHRRAVIDELLRREIFIVVRKTLLDCAPEQRLVLCGGDLIVIRQA